MSTTEPMTTTVEGRNCTLRDCPACGASRDRGEPSGYGEGEWQLLRCPDCSFHYLAAVPIFEELAETHQWTEVAADWTKQRKKKYPILQALNNATKWRMHIFKRKRAEDLIARYCEKGNVLDVGCGKGNQLKKLAAQFTPYGVEISQSAAARGNEVLKERGGKIVAAPAVEGLQSFDDNFFDAVMMMSYLEHEAQPKEVMDEVGRVLKPGGIAVIKVPNFGCLNRKLMGKSWSGFRWPEHLNQFTPETLLAMCQPQGLKTISFSKFPLSDTMWLVARMG